MDRTTENWTKSPVRTVVLDWTAAALVTVTQLSLAEHDTPKFIF
jgi:hypothetical protein